MRRGTRELWAEQHDSKCHSGTWLDEATHPLDRGRECFLDWFLARSEHLIHIPRLPDVFPVRLAGKRPQPVSNSRQPVEFEGTSTRMALLQ